MNLTYNGPIENWQTNPSVQHVCGLVLEGPESYWTSGGGDAALTYEDNDGQYLGQMIFLFREPYGMHVRFFPKSGGWSVLVSGNETEEVTVQHGGAPFTVPRNQFVVSRAIAAAVIGAYMEARDALRPDGDWIE